MPNDYHFRYAIIHPVIARYKSRINMNDDLTKTRAAVTIFSFDVFNILKIGEVSFQEIDTRMLFHLFIVLR